ncbi:hypothetical protein JQ597_28865 [Bradyrhizobium sp. AUGA SZCCT0177]|uniref:ParB/Srx family N-terminal domain-containing protein n=1 Tax=Bradyrhizobium sp. AUGA SZCCT0177 TaxID=2807665 RepID=UPI001BA90D53|nr:ParB/Srx family N-terminal domain-containing protein [Bradyrhizobium sp. AUGA SZCCT0177]MBR1286070.1 hypothetical protein [Bradyrhizobium sp. AUGA SZCCT0177]
MTETKQPKSWRDVIKVHPAADMFPMMTADELKALGEDIKKNGMRTRVAVIDGPDDKPILIDGRNRLDAMEMVGLEIVLENVAMLACCRKCDAGFDPYTYVISANIHRRHLTAEQKRELIAAVLKAQPAKSNRTIAKQTKANHKTVGAVRDKLEATGEIPQLAKTVGADGKARKPPAEKAKPEAVDLPIQDPPSADWDTEQDRWQFSVGSFAGDAIAMKAFFDKHFPAWREFPVPPELLTLVNQAAESWRMFAGELKAKKG